MRIGDDVKVTVLGGHEDQVTFGTVAARANGRDLRAFSLGLFNRGNQAQNSQHYIKAHVVG